MPNPHMRIQHHGGAEDCFYCMQDTPELTVAITGWTDSVDAASMIAIHPSCLTQLAADARREPKTF